MGKKFTFQKSKLIQLYIILSLSSVATADSNRPIITEGTPWSDTLMEFSLSAPKADDGRDGLSYRNQTASHGSWSGQDGTSGRDAGNGEQVDNADNASSGRLVLDSLSAGVITFSGSFIGRNRKSLKARLNSSGFFRAVARGGNGSMPGFGGWGEAGGNGARGSDGVGKQSGGDGGDGGHGGDPGRGYNGSDAGDGGNIRVGIPKEKLELAWAIEALAPGGLGGTHSEHGIPGQGGTGGAGGTGGTWSEEVPRTRQVPETDSDGNTTYTTEHYTETVWHKEPDGSRGRNGRDGREITIPLRDGRHGEEGSVVWEVLDSEGNVLKEASNRFQLNLENFKIVDLNNGSPSDGIFEPGEQGVITDIWVRNNGGIETPKGVKTRLVIKSGSYFYTEEMSFEIPEGLNPGEPAMLKNAEGEPLRIPFQVKDFALGSPKEEPFVRSERIKPIGRADVAGVVREVPELMESISGNPNKDELTKFTVQFPVLVEPVTTLPNLAPGEASKFIFRITNISGRDFGSESEIKRHLEFFIKRSGGDLTRSEEGIEFFDKDGNPLDINTGMLKAVMNLKANESTLVESIVGVSPAAESYRYAGITTDLRIDRNGYSEGEDLRAVQRRSVHINISDDYYKTPDSDFLLVTNNKLSRGSYEAWKHLIEDKLHSDLDIWDLSYKNFISFVGKLGEYGEEAKGDGAYDEFKTSIAEDFKGKTIILMANEFESGAGKTEMRTVWDYINMRDLRSACALHGINLYVIGEKNEGRVEDMYIPRRNENLTVEYTTFDELYDAVEQGEGIVNREANKDAAYWETGLKGTLSSWRFFTQPRVKLAKRRAQRLYERAMRENPDADFLTVHRFDASRTAPVGFSFKVFGKEIRPFGSEWEVGEIELWRSVAPSIGNIVMKQMPDWEVFGKIFANSQENLMNLFLTRSFEENLKDFEYYLSHYNEITEGQKDALPVLVKALEKMLVFEQVSLRYRASFIKRREAILGERLGYLKALSEMNYQFDDQVPEDVRDLIGDMILNVLEYTKGQKKWWERWLPLPRTRNAKISNFAEPVIEKILKRFYSSLYKKKELKAYLKDLLDQKREAVKAERREGETWQRLTLRRIEIDEIVERIPSYRGVMSGNSFDSEQARLEGLDVSVEAMSDDMKALRDELETGNPILERFSMGQAKSCKAVLNY